MTHIKHNINDLMHFKLNKTGFKIDVWTGFETGFLLLWFYIKCAMVIASLGFKIQILKQMLIVHKV